MISRTCSLHRKRPPLILNRGYLDGSGGTVPEDGTDGWQTGAFFQHTDGGANTAFYVNEGTVTSCSFRPVEVGTDVAGESEAIEFADDLTGPLISIDTTDPTGTSYTTPFILTGTYSSDCALGIQLSATNQRPVSFVFDDGAAVLGSGNYRGVLSRIMLCATQTGQVAIRAIRGQVKVADTIDVNIATNEMNAFNGVEGYIELSGATAKTIGANTRVAAVHALLEVNQDITLTAGGKMIGVFSELSQVTAKTVSGIGTAAFAADRLDSDHTTNQALWTVGYVTGDNACTTAIKIGRCEQCINYTTVTAIDEPGVGHLMQYGASGAPIQWTPTATCSGVEMYITSDGPAGGGFALTGIRSNVTLTGTTRITVNAGQFWTKINCTDYTGDYTGGHPTGLSGVIELAGTAYTAASPYAVQAGVCGEVRPVVTSGTVNVGGVLCGVHAKVFAVSTDVDTGDVVGVFVQAISDSAADIGILVGTHTGGAAWTTGLEFDTTYGPIANGIVFTGAITTRVIDYASETAIDEPGAGHLLRYGASGADVPWTPTATASGLQMYITSTGPAGGGFGIAGVRVKLTVTGTTRITANAGQFWTKIDCDDYTGHYLGGHPTGLSGVIECAGTSRTATSPYAVMAGVCGEVRPITTTTPDMGGVICGLHAKIFGVASEVTTGSVVGLFVQAIAGSAADIGILIQPHTGGAAWTTGLKIDSVYGAISTAIEVVSSAKLFTGTSALAGGTALSAFEITTVSTQTHGAATYQRSIHVDHTHGTGAAAGEINVIGVDLQCTSNIGQAYCFTAYTGSLNGATINRVAHFSSYVDACTGTVNELNCAFLEHAGGGTYDAFIAVRSHEVGGLDAIISDLSGGKTATNLFEFTAATGPATEAAGTYTTAEGYMTVKVNGSTYRMPFYTGTDA